MINLINGSLSDPQESIQWVENEPSAIVILNTHTWKIGELLIVGYKTKGENKDIMIAVGINNGVGPSCYRVVIDKSVVVVSEVLDTSPPDVSYYAFNQRYVVKIDDKLYFTRRYVEEGTGVMSVEKIEITDRCIIVETSTRDIWICDPPGIINFLDLTTRAIIENITDLGYGQVMIDLTEHGKTWRDLCFVNPEEKSYLSEKIFEKNFEASLKGQKYDSNGNAVLSNDPCIVSSVTYTLTTKYSGERVDLDIIPDGWRRTGIGIYTKTIPGNTTSTSGLVKCVLTTSGYTGEKTISSITMVVDKYIFLIYSKESFTKIEGANKSTLSSTPSLGKITVIPPQDNYVWLAFPNTMTPSEITQLGVGYVSRDTTLIKNVTKSGVNLGNYVVYRSLNPGNGEPQEINIK